MVYADEMVRHSAAMKSVLSSSPPWFGISNHRKPLQFYSAEATAFLVFESYYFFIMKSKQKVDFKLGEILLKFLFLQSIVFTNAIAEFLKENHPKYATYKKKRGRYQKFFNYGYLDRHNVYLSLCPWAEL